MGHKDQRKEMQNEMSRSWSEVARLQWEVPRLVGGRKAAIGGREVAKMSTLSPSILVEAASIFASFSIRVCGVCYLGFNHWFQTSLQFLMLGLLFEFKICIGTTYFHVVLSPITNSVTRFELVILLWVNRVYSESTLSLKKTSLRASELVNNALTRRLVRVYESTREFDNHGWEYNRKKL